MRLLLLVLLVHFSFSFSGYSQETESIEEKHLLELSEILEAQETRIEKLGDSLKEREKRISDLKISLKQNEKALEQMETLLKRQEETIGALDKSFVYYEKVVRRGNLKAGFFGSTIGIIVGFIGGVVASHYMSK